MEAGKFPGKLISPPTIPPTIPPIRPKKIRISDNSQFSIPSRPPAPRLRQT